MNVVQISVNHIKNVIPRMILEDVFANRYAQYRASPISIEERIRKEVILGRVLPDCQMEYGLTTFVSLSGLRAEYLPGNDAVIVIPKERTGGLSIMSALSIMYANPTGLNNTNQYGTRYDGSVITQATGWLMDAHDNHPMYSSSRVTLVGENTILVKGLPMIGDNMMLECILENDEALNTLKPKSIPVFKQLIVLAVKAYIYNTLILEIDTARLTGGHDLGKYREIVESYSDAEEQYNELLQEKIGVTFFLNDEEQTTRHIRFMLGGPR